MNDEGQEELQKLQQEKVKAEQDRLQNSYRDKGFQKISYKEYEALRNKKKPAKKIPAHIQLILGTPFLIICCFGLIFIPYMLFVIATGKDASAHKSSPSAITKSSSDAKAASLKGTKAK
jgi:hypothetical protein